MNTRPPYLSPEKCVCRSRSSIRILHGTANWFQIGKGVQQGYCESEVTQLCPTLCDPMDCRLPGSSVHGIFQARILEWTAISFPRGSSQPGIKFGSPTLWADALPSKPPEKAVVTAYLTYMHSTSCKMSGWKTHKLESRLSGEI